ncbi:MAG: hypothetical protein ACXW3U_13165 [Rhodoplanes sp.]
MNHGRRGTCIAFGNMRIDAAVSAEVLRAIAPFGLEASMQAITDRERDGAERLRQIELALQLWRRRAIAEQVIAAFEPCPLPSMIRSGGSTGAGSGTIYWDATGGTSDDAVAFAKITAGSALQATDFHVVADTAGLRLAFLLGPPEIVDLVARTRVANGLSSIAIDFLLFALAERALSRRSSATSQTGVTHSRSICAGRARAFWTRERVTALRSHHRIPVWRPAENGIEPWLNLTRAAKLLGISQKTPPTRRRSSRYRPGPPACGRPVDLPPRGPRRSSG